MTKSGKALLTIFLLTPLLTFAHGEQVLLPFVFDFFNLLIFLFALVMIKLNRRGKLILAGIYFLTMGIVNYWFLTQIKYLDYLENVKSVNLMIFVIPLIVFVGSWLGLRTKFKSTESDKADKNN